VTHDGRSAIAVHDVIATDRLLLRRWREEDREPFAAMNEDPQVMEYMPGLMSHQESDSWVDDRVLAHFDAYGYGLWAVERRDTGDFIGFVGLLWQTFEA
jgi:ribosomal-protein-alanine N-acetyltransferase